MNTTNKIWLTKQVVNALVLMQLSGSQYWEENNGQTYLEIIFNFANLKGNCKDTLEKVNETLNRHQKDVKGITNIYELNIEGLFLMAKDSYELDEIDFDEFNGVDNAHYGLKQWIESPFAFIRCLDNLINNYQTIVEDADLTNKIEEHMEDLKSALISVYKNDLWEINLIKDIDAETDLIPQKVKQAKHIGIAQDKILEAMEELKNCEDFEKLCDKESYPFKENFVSVINKFKVWVYETKEKNK